MARPVTLFTAQWADLPFETMCQMASDWGFDGLEIACWGDHFEVDKAIDLANIEIVNLSERVGIFLRSYAVEQEFFF